MDQLELETFFFFVPCRLLWVNWKKMMGERANPADSISYTIPIIVNVNAFVAGTIGDHMGIPVSNLVGDKSANSLPLRAYNLIWNDWFRDQNLQTALVVDTTDGPDNVNNYALRRRNKKHDYFTSALPWPLKGGVEVSAGLAGMANVFGLATSSTIDPTDGTPANNTHIQTGGADPNDLAWTAWMDVDAVNDMIVRMTTVGAGGAPLIKLTSQPQPG